MSVSFCSSPRPPTRSSPRTDLRRHPLIVILARNPRTVVRLATTAQEKEEICRLRYQVYIEEMRGEHRHVEADRETRQLRDQWDEDAYHFYVRRGESIIACARLNLRRNGPLECEEQFALKRFKPWFPNHVSMTSRLVVAPKVRGSHVLKPLMCAMYQFAREQNIQYNFIDCHPRLLPLYSRFGYRLYQPGFNHRKYTYVLPMVLVLEDVQHLECVRSPFLPIALNYSNSTTGRQLLFSRFPNVAKSDVTVKGDPQVFWTVLRDRLLEPRLTVERFDLLEGLRFDEAKALLSLGHIVNVRAGDVVLNPGDLGRDVFLILKGSFQVQKREPMDEGLKLVKLLVVGDTFGEIRFLREELRQASVKAREDSTVLLLNGKFLERLVIIEPKIAAKLFRNLANIVVTRLSEWVPFMRSSRRRAARLVNHAD